MHIYIQTRDDALAGFFLERIYIYIYIRMRRENIDEIEEGPLCMERIVNRSREWRLAIIISVRSGPRLWLRPPQNWPMRNSLFYLQNWCATRFTCIYRFAHIYITLAITSYERAIKASVNASLYVVKEDFAHQGYTATYLMYKLKCQCVPKSEEIYLFSGIFPYKESLRKIYVNQRDRSFRNLDLKCKKV